jgi:tetratricopeptide (TPR) repeat protein
MAVIMGCGPFQASLGTVFVPNKRGDTVQVATAEGGEIEIPAPDLREFLDYLVGNLDSMASQDYDPIFRRVDARAAEVCSRLDAERRDAPARLAELLGVPSRAARRSAVQSGIAFRTYEVASLVLERSRTAVHHDPIRARDLAELGLTIAEQLDSDAYGRDRVRNLQAYAEAVLGNALRVAGHLQAAVQSFRGARQRLGGGGEYSLEAIEIDGLEGSLRRDVRDFQEALRLSSRAIEGYKALGMMQAAALGLLTRATIYESLGESVAALDTLREAAATVDTRDDPWTCLMVRHNLIFGLARAGHFDDASRCFAETRGLYEQFVVPAVIGRRHWVEGLIEQGCGNPTAAGDSLTRARAMFETHGYHFDAALVSLDLAAALAEQGRFAEVRELAAATYTLLESQGVHRDALAALAQFQQAAAREQLDREVLRQIAQRLTRAAEFRPLPA